MNPSGMPPERVPTLTEVVHWPGVPGATAPQTTSVAGAPTAAVPAPAAAPAPPSVLGLLRPAANSPPPSPRRPDDPLPEAPASASGQPAASAPRSTAPNEPAAARAFTGADEEALTQQVCADLLRQVELMLEYRLRETLAPLLARAADSIVRDARTELASTLRDMVARAVAQELARHRTR